MNGCNRTSRYLLALALTLPGLATAGEVTLTGEGSVRYEPDSARFQFTASAEHELPQKATERVAALMEQWREGITSFRDELNEYSDATVNLYSRTLPALERGKEPRKQAVASQTISFSISDLTLLNPILQQAQTVGLDYRLGPNQFFHTRMRQAWNRKRWPEPLPTPGPGADLWQANSTKPAVMWSPSTSMEVTARFP